MAAASTGRKRLARSGSRLTGAPVVVSTRRLMPAIAAFVIGLAAILGAWGFQLIGGYVPCKLCLEQRVPYYTGLPILALGIILLASGRKAALSRVVLILAGAIFIVGAGLGVYHAGVEWGFWLGPADCGGGTSTTGNAADLLSQISSIKVVSCTEASWRLLGLSFAGWNVVASAIVAALSLTAAFRR